MTNNQYHSQTRKTRSITEPGQLKHLFEDAVRKNIASGQDIYDAVSKARNWLWRILDRQKKNELSIEQHAELMNTLDALQYQGREPTVAKIPATKPSPAASKSSGPLPVTRESILTSLQQYHTLRNCEYWIPRILIEQAGNVQKQKQLLEIIAGRVRTIFCRHARSGDETDTALKEAQAWMERRVSPTPRKQTPQRTGVEGFAAKYGNRARLPV